MPRSAARALSLPTPERRRPLLALGLGLAMLALMAASARAAGPEMAATGAAPKAPAGDAAAFARHWYDGRAELTGYALKKARYGELHDGHAVLVFVTEPFSRKKHVKLDAPRTGDADAAPVLKLNLSEKFETGIYPYSVLLSVFTPVDLRADPRSLKATMTMQEWCGHVFLQLDAADGGWRHRSFSYFESEGDTEGVIEEAMLEDELWSRIRIDPGQLPLGDLRLVPATIDARLRHRGLKAEKATARLVRDGELLVYAIEYPRLGRALRIRFRPSFPFEIEGWEEDVLSGWGPGARRLTTTAKATGRLRLDYWNKNDPADRALRARLGLTP